MVNYEHKRKCSAVCDSARFEEYPDHIAVAFLASGLGRVTIVVTIIRYEHQRLLVGNIERISMKRSWEQNRQIISLAGAAFLHHRLDDALDSVRTQPQLRKTSTFLMRSVPILTIDRPSAAEAYQNGRPLATIRFDHRSQPEPASNVPQLRPWSIAMQIHAPPGNFKLRQFFL